MKILLLPRIHYDKMSSTLPSNIVAHHVNKAKTDTLVVCVVTGGLQKRVRASVSQHCDAHIVEREDLTSMSIMKQK